MTKPQPSTTLWLVRHGQTDWNLIGRYQGQADQPLNAAGLAQAHELAGRLANERFDAICSSDLIRARQTADIIGSALGMQPMLEPRLREIDQGEWEGLFFNDLVTRYEAELLRHRGDPAVGPPGGETLVQVAARAGDAADDLARLYPGGRVLVVSHGLTISTLLAAARGTPLANAYQTIPANSQVEVISWSCCSPI